MGIAEMAAATIGGVFDKFDQARGVSRWIENMVDEADMPIELHGVQCKEERALFNVPQGETMHIYDPKAEMKRKLARARKSIDIAELRCQRVLSELDL